MRNFLFMIFGIALGFSAAAVSDSSEQKPNVLFIFADDQSSNTINALGNNEVITPNLDRLTDAGVSFTNAYNMGAWHGAVCVASRAMLNTGMTLWRAGKNEEHFPQRAEQGQMWGNLMKQAGYDTYITGKWHVHTEVKSCFDHIGHIRGGMPNQTPEGYSRPQTPGDTTWLPWHRKYGGYWKGGKHWTEVVGDETIEFLEQAKNSENPFFMYVAFNAPHDPRQSPKEYVDMYPLENITVPANFLPEYPHKQEIGCYKVENRQGKTVMQRDENLAPYPRTEYSIKVNRQEYYAIITHLDNEIGRIIDKLKETGQADNTYIFYSADHGLAVGHHGLVGKQNMFEHSMKAPLIVVGPDVPKDKTNDGLVYIQDIMASALDVAGIEQPDYVEFRSLMPGTKKTDKGNYKSVYGAYKDLQRMVRMDDYKLIVFPKVPVAYLFNLKDDPQEMNNLIDDPKYKKIKKKLYKELRKLQKEYGDELVLHER